jgi:hypothetical protein
MKNLTLNDKIVLAILIAGHCQGGFENREQGEISLIDGYKMSDFVQWSKDERKLIVRGDNISYSVDRDELKSTLNIFGNVKEIYALKHELNLANKIAETFEANGINIPDSNEISSFFPKLIENLVEA